MKDNEATLTLQVSDVTAQKSAEVSDVVPDATVAELVDSLLAQLRMPQHDSEGRPLSYAVRRERDGLQIHESERIGTALRTGDHIVLQPNVDAG